MAGRDGRQRASVGRFENKGDDVVGFIDAAEHAVWTRRLVGVHIRLLVQARFLGDQLEREQPIDLTPGGGDLGGDGIAEHLTDGSEQIRPQSCTAQGGCPGIRACRRCAA